MRSEELFAAAGGLGATYRAIDWSAGPLGAPEQWSPELATAARMVLRSRFPMALMWGEELVRLYNEPYVELVGDKHPAALGRPTREVFPEIWATIGPMLSTVLTGGEATYDENRRLGLVRHGFVEDCYFTFSYSPVPVEDGTIRGVLVVASETTLDVIACRRLELLATLRDTLTSIEDGDDLPGRALELLQQYPDDLPAVDLRRSLHAGGTGEVESAGRAFAAGLPQEVRPRVRHRSGQDSAGRDAVERAASGRRASGSLPDSPHRPIPVTAELVVDEDEDGATIAWMPLKTTTNVTDPPFLVVAVNPRMAFDEDYRMFLRLLASTMAHTFSRMEVLAAERLVASTERAISESLQLSLLGPPIETPGVKMAARYLPAASDVKIGGDWFDTFHGPDGSLHMVIGDVTGHDRHAAVLMAQARNILRGIAYTLNLSPARTMEAFDQAMAGLDTEALLTAILARAVFANAEDGTGLVQLTWTNAGHPAPMVMRPDGSVVTLDQAHEPLLGLLPDRARSESTTTLEPGSFIVLYTDGLIERRGEALDVGSDRLRAALIDQTALTAHELADHLLAALGQSDDDDTAILVLKVEGTHHETVIRLREPDVLGADQIYSGPS